MDVKKMDMWWLWSVGGAALAALGWLVVRKSKTPVDVRPDPVAPPSSAPGSVKPPQPQPTNPMPKPPTPSPSPNPAPAPTPKPTDPGHPYEIATKGTWQFWTPPEFAVESGPRVDAPWGGSVTALPLKDSRTGGFARLKYRDAITVAQKLGAQLLSTSEQDQLSKVGIMLEPCLLPNAAMAAKGAKPGDAAMSSLEWANAEDACIRQQLDALGYDGYTIVNNAGKDWIRGAPAGRAINRGWYKKGGGMWQTTGTAHDDGHTDYSQLTRLVW